MTLKQSPASSKRVGVVEIGSRATRFLLADISAGRLSIARSDWQETGLAAAKAAGGSAFDTRISEIIQAVNNYVVQSRSSGASRMCIFATEAVRRMSEEHRGLLMTAIPRLEIIDRKTEASCALMGAVSPFDEPKTSSQHFVIDQGTGSMELAVGSLSGSGVVLSSYRSYALGTQELIEDLGGCSRDLASFRKKIQRKVQAFKLIEANAELRATILGSAATKMAWIRVRGSSDRYEPSRVHGQILDLASVDKFIDMAIAAPAAIRAIIDPKNPQSTEFETVITGLIAIVTFLRAFGRVDFQVSAYGPRYGVVWMTAQFDELGFDL